MGTSWMVYIFPLLTIAALVAFFVFYYRSVGRRRETLEWVGPLLPLAYTQEIGPMIPPAPKERRRFRFDRRYPMERRDALPLLILTAVYAVTAFWGLGDMTAPQRFCLFPEPGSALEMHLSEPVTVSSLMYYTGLSTGDYTVEYSQDGESWTHLATLEQGYADLFKWKQIDLTTGNAQIVAFRVTGQSKNLELGELAFFSGEGELLLASDFIDLTPGGQCLVDEPEMVPERSSYMNSTYFDEIYHARTAYEHIRNIYPYEVTHPPLGKLILGIGIQLFGMTPFGWRVIGTLFGVLMLPILYVFFKNLFGKTPIALCGTALFAFDFMHLTQTRIATIDTYAVFFILAMYFFMYRFLTTPTSAPFGKAALPLALSGLMFGLGAASKWTVFYAAVGLAFLFFFSLFLRYREAKRAGEKGQFYKWLGKTLGLAVLCFLAVPGLIYCLSYLPYAAAKGEPLSWQLIWDNQVYMLTYHQGVDATHPYSSDWWQWIFDIRPILYYLDNDVGGLKSAFAAFSNPVVCWGGLLAMVAVGWRMVKKRCGIALLIIVGYLSQLVFWIPITRPTFAYHYFPSILFLVFALTYVLNDIWEEKRKHYKAAVYGLTGGATFLYAAFYPVLTGIAVPAWYGTNFLKWLPSWPL